MVSSGPLVDSSSVREEAESWDCLRLEATIEYIIRWPRVYARIWSVPRWWCPTQCRVTAPSEWKPGSAHAAIFGPPRASIKSSDSFGQILIWDPSLTECSVWWTVVRRIDRFIQNLKSFFLRVSRIWNLLARLFFVPSEMARILMFCQVKHVVRNSIRLWGNGGSSLLLTIKRISFLHAKPKRLCVSLGEHELPDALSTR